MMVRYDQHFYKVAFHDPPRQGSMDKEYESLKNNKTFDYVSLPPERRDKSNFLHDKLEAKIYMEKHKGYTNDSLLTCKLSNPLYGLN